MKKCLVVLVLIVAMSVCSIGYTYDGKGSGDRPLRNELLNQLPTDKETLFHQTMREVRGKTANIREQIRDLKAEINDILIAPEFNEVLFLEKTKSLEELHQTIRDAKEKAIAKLAGQFNQEERKILAKLIHQKHRYHDRQPGR